MNKNTNEEFVLGIDLGTSSCKSVVLSINGHVVTVGSSDYPAKDFHLKWEEQNPEELVSSMILSVRHALSMAGISANNCVGISIGGALHSLLAMDIHHQPLTGVMTWADGRSANQVKNLGQTYDMHLHYLNTGCPNHPMYSISKIVWLKEMHPDIFRKAYRFISAKEYIGFRITGQYVVDPSIAAGSGLLDVRALSWNKESLKIAEIQESQLSPIENPKSEIGILGTSFGELIGLPARTPIFLGSSDAVNSSLGAGAVNQNQLTCMVGTSGAIRVIADQPILDTMERTWCYAMDPDHWIVGGAINNGGLALQWLLDALSKGRQSESSSMPPSFEDIFDWAVQIEPGASGLICLPFFANERSPNWNPNARGVFYGLTIRHDQRHLARAVLEGVGFRLRSVIEVLDEIVGKKKEVRASGGFTQSRLWLQITANILNRTLLVPKINETSALGAAFWAILGLNVVERIEAVAKYVTLSATFCPDGKVREIYDKSYDSYVELYRLLRDYFDKNAQQK